MSAERVVLTSCQDVRDAFRQRDLKQALYDAGGAVMADSLITLHGEEHKLRRRVENRLFRRGTFRWWELNLVPGIVADAFAGPVAAGRADLVGLGRRTIMYLTGLVAGIDPPQTERAADALEEFSRVFSAGATVVHSTRPRQEVNAEVARAMREFDEMFVEPSRQRRLALLADLRAGRIAAEDLPRDVLMAVLRNQAELGVDDDVIRREVAFYLQAGSHSTANLFTHAAHQVFTRLDDPGFAARLADPVFVRRCVHETLRLHPASPVAWRRALAEVELRSGVTLPAGTLVELDLVAANTDPAVWGPDGGAFNPDRDLPQGVMPWGHSFGGGMHACIGMELDGGVPPESGGEEHEPVYGTVALMLRALLEHGARPDPDQPPVRDPDSQRDNFARYPVIFAPW
ncbi:MAG TPA: cytochrome P450 [Streptosporangiaceae bacterium]|nr:cytochrome P450 [Streptosporangiaceae bacterium]